MVGGVGGLAAALELTLQIPDKEKQKNVSNSIADEYKPVDKPGDLIPEEGQGGVVSYSHIHFVAWS